MIVQQKYVRAVIYFSWFFCRLQSASSYQCIYALSSVFSCVSDSLSRLILFNILRRRISFAHFCQMLFCPYSSNKRPLQFAIRKQRECWTKCLESDELLLKKKTRKWTYEVNIISNRRQSVHRYQRRKMKAIKMSQIPVDIHRKCRSKKWRKLL